MPLTACRSRIRTLDDVDSFSPVERAAQILRGASRLEDVAVHRHQVSLAVVLHIHYRGEDDAAAEAIFGIDGGVTDHPEAAVGVHEAELPGHPAVVFLMTDAVKVLLADLGRRWELHLGDGRRSERRFDAGHDDLLMGRAIAGIARRAAVPRLA